MTSPRRPTQKDIAQKAGVTQSTVSLALSLHPSISEETRNRILGVAAELGYHPDPYLAGLSAYRKKLAPTQFQASLAWISNYPKGDSWQRISAFRNYFEGACSRAIELGYKVEEHLLCAEGMTPERLASILKARNISGLLIAPQPNPGTELPFPIDEFSAVAFGYTLVAPRLHVVTSNHFREVRLIFKELKALGYRRPGLALGLQDDLRSNCIWSAAFWREQLNLPGDCRVPLLLEPALTARAFQDWFRQYRPDVVVAMQEQVYQWMLDAGLRVPGEAGFAILSTPENNPLYSGLWGNPRLVGSRAVEYLIELIHRAERGEPEIPVHLLVEGSWKSGQTVRRQQPAC